jgi:hypothetical protein
MMVVESTWEESPLFTISLRRRPTTPLISFHDNGGVHVEGVNTLHDLLKEADHPYPYLHPPLSSRRWPTPPHIALP